MSNNIWGYQGLQTPLENLTKGNYNVADYTNMRKEFNARLQALENQGGFIPTNVSIQGYCNIVPGTNGYGNFSVTGTTILGGTLSVAQSATFSGNVSVAGVLSISNVTTAQVTANSAVISGNITSTSGQFIGNGAGLTGVVATDNTKLPLAGGSMTGSLAVRTVSVISGFPVYNYKGNRYTSFNNSSPGGTFTVTQLNSSVHDYIRLEFNSACTVNLVNLVTTDNTYYQDQQRLATITKRFMSGADYAVTVLPPSGYTFFSKVASGAASYSIPLGVFSVTFMISSANTVNVVDVISTVSV